MNINIVSTLFPTVIVVLVDLPIFWFTIVLQLWEITMFNSMFTDLPIKNGDFPWLFRFCHPLLTPSSNHQPPGPHVDPRAGRSRPWCQGRLGLVPPSSSICTPWYIWLVVWNFFSIYWEFQNPNWRAHIFQRGWNHQPDKYTYIYIHIHIYIYIYIYICICVILYTIYKLNPFSMYNLGNNDARTYIYIYIYICLFVNIYIYIHIIIHLHTPMS